MIVYILMGMTAEIGHSTKYYFFLTKSIFFFKKKRGETRKAILVFENYKVNERVEHLNVQISDIHKFRIPKKKKLLLHLCFSCVTMKKHKNNKSAIYFEWKSACRTGQFVALVKNVCALSENMYKWFLTNSFVTPRLFFTFHHMLPYTRALIIFPMVIIIQREIRIDIMKLFKIHVSSQIY